MMVSVSAVLPLDTLVTTVGERPTQYDSTSSEHDTALSINTSGVSLPYSQVCPTLVERKLHLVPVLEIQKGFVHQKPYIVCQLFSFLPCCV